MALVDSTWYCDSVGYAAVTVRPQNTAVVAGVIRRQFTTPAVGSERCFICIVAGTTANTTDATWTLTRGAKVTDGSAQWQECTGQASLNGDLTNTKTWAEAKAATPAVLGQIIKRSNGASYQICTTAGAMSGSEPSFSDTAGVTTTDTTAVWTSLGVVGNFTGGQAPFARLASAVATTWFAAGSTVYVASVHAESQASSITITPVVSVSTVGRILCHDSGAYPPAAANLTTGATVSMTTNGTITINPTSGALYVNGVTFKAGVGSAGASVIALTGTSMWGRFDNCSFWLATTSNSAATNIQCGANNACTLIFDNTTLKFAGNAQILDLESVNFTWQNTGQVLESGSTVPLVLISSLTTARMSTAVLEALDLSQITTTIFSSAGVAVQPTNWLLKDCKLHASATIAATPLFSGQTIQVVRCDSGATAYKSSRYQYEGTETTETSITRVGGAEDPTGQAQSRKIVTTANAQWLRPFKAEPYAIWNSTTGATVTVTIYGTVNAGAVPNNDDIWLELAYLGDGSYPLGEIVTTTKATLLTTNAAVASDVSTWNGGGSGGGWSPFKLVATLSSPQPAMVGYLDVRVRAAKISTTWYIDPKIELS